MTEEQTFTQPKSKLERISDNHNRQKQLLEENDGVVFGLHRSSLDNLSSILETGFRGADSSYYGTGYRQDVKDAVWFEEDTNIEGVLQTAEAHKYSNGFAVIKASLKNPKIDPEDRPFWYIPKASERQSDIEIEQIDIYRNDGEKLLSFSTENVDAFKVFLRNINGK